MSAPQSAAVRPWASVAAGVGPGHQQPAHEVVPLSVHGYVQGGGPPVERPAVNGGTVVEQVVDDIAGPMLTAVTSTRSRGRRMGRAQPRVRRPRPACRRFCQRGQELRRVVPIRLSGRTGPARVGPDQAASPQQVKAPVPSGSEKLYEPQRLVRRNA